MTTSIRSEATQSVVSVNGVDRLTINNDGSVELLTDNLFPSGKDVVGMVNFGSSLAANGYQKLPSGLIIQWGSAPAAGGTGVAVTFPITFPTAVYSLAGMAMAVSDGDFEILQYMNLTNTGFTAYGDAGRWIAIGY